MAGRYQYGFNLGQIEGLDSSVKIVTLTIANATESNTYTLTYTTDKYDNDLWTDDINFENDNIQLYHYTGEEVFKLRTLFLTPSDVGDTYNVTISTSAVEENFKSAVETVLVDNGLINAPETLFNGTITITAEDRQGVEIPFDMDVSSYPIEKWTVTVNDEPLEYNGEVFANVTETHVYVVGNNNGVYRFLARNDDGIIPGDYQVKITGIAGEGGGESGVTYFKFNTISELPTFEQVQRLVNNGHALMFLRKGAVPPVQFDFNESDNPFYKISYFNVASANATIDMYTVQADGGRIEQIYNTNLTLTQVSD